MRSGRRKGKEYDPQWWDRYYLVRELTGGGQSQAYLVRDQSKRYFVIKIPDPGVAQTEFDLTSLAHARYPTGTVHPHGLLHPPDALPYLVLSYLPGTLLKDYVDNPGVLTFAHLKYIFTQIGNCFTAWQGSYVSLRGHEDAYPLFWGDVANYNAMFWVGKKEYHLTTFDFGNAYLGRPELYDPTSELRRRLATQATPGTIPPEQIIESREDGQVFHPEAAATFGLAVMAYHLLAGKDPYPGMTDATSNLDLMNRLRLPMIPIEIGDLRIRFGSHIKKSDAYLAKDLSVLNGIFINALNFWLIKRAIQHHTAFINALLPVLEEIATSSES